MNGRHIKESYDDSALIAAVAIGGFLFLTLIALASVFLGF